MADEARAPHKLFGTFGPLVRDSAPAWATRAAQEIQTAVVDGHQPILVGGTGLYLHALMVGMPPIPAISPDIRARARAMLADIGHAAFHAQLAARDPVLGARLKVGDTQRLLRAYEVVEATGRPLSAWQADPPVPPLHADYFTILLSPERAERNAAIDARFLAMIAAGAIAEVAALHHAGVPTSAPVMRVLGAPDLAAYLAGEIDLPTAIVQGRAASRQYAQDRQATWFKGQLRASLTIYEKYSERLTKDIFPKIRNCS